MLVQIMRDNMKAMANGDEFPARDIVAQKIQANRGNVPDDLLAMLRFECSKVLMEVYTNELMGLLDHAFKEVYVGPKGVLDEDFGMPIRRNVDKWREYVRKVEKLLVEYVTTHSKKTPTGFVGKALVLLTWSRDSAVQPLPLMTESAILALQAIFVQFPLALTEVGTKCVIV